MTDKPKTKKVPAKAGALRRLSDREVEAHKATGSAWGEGIVPRDKTIAMLAGHGVGVEAAETIIAASWDHLGRYRMDANLIDKRLTPTEIVEQARMTAEIAKELERRIRYMEPNIKGMAHGEAHRAWGERMLSPEFQTDLTRLQVLMGNVAGTVDAHARKTVTKRTGPRNRLLGHVADAITESCPEKTQSESRAIAADLLRCWGIQTPADDREQRRAAKRGKSP